jgi:hypothetical protein
MYVIRHGAEFVQFVPIRIKEFKRIVHDLLELGIAEYARSYTTIQPFLDPMIETIVVFLPLTARPWCPVEF